VTGEKKGVVTDADGTLWGFPEYFVPAMRIIVPMLAALFSEKLGRLVTWDRASSIRAVIHVPACPELVYPWAGKAAVQIPFLFGGRLTEVDLQHAVFLGARL
jgi:hypothetical protein